MTSQARWEFSYPRTEIWKSSATSSIAMQTGIVHGDRIARTLISPRRQKLRVYMWCLLNVKRASGQLWCTFDRFCCPQSKNTSFWKLMLPAVAWPCVWEIYARGGQASITEVFKGALESWTIPTPARKRDAVFPVKGGLPTRIIVDQRLVNELGRDYSAIWNMTNWPPPSEKWSKKGNTSYSATSTNGISK